MESSPKSKVSKVTIDYREPFSLVEGLPKSKDFSHREIVIGSLEVGDYLLETDKLKVLIERKGIDTDFFSSLVSGRLSDQLARLLEYDCDQRILLIHGELLTEDNRTIQRKNHLGVSNTGWTTNQFLSILLSVQAAGIICVNTKGDLIQTLNDLFTYWEKPHHSLIRHRVIGNKPSSEYKARLSVLMSFPGIGEELAEVILSQTTLQEVLQSPESLLSIKGIGKKKVQAIQEIISGK